MKQLTCEMCGSTDLMKQDGVFVCQTCGTKYSVEEAKKMMMEVTGNVTVTNTANVDSLYKLAVSSYESNNHAKAEDFCNQILSINDQHFDAWVLKAKAIDGQIKADNPRIDEVVNCILTAYRNCQEDQKEEQGQLLLAWLLHTFKTEITFWLNQIEVKRPTDGSINRAKNAYIDVWNNAKKVSEEIGLGSWDIEKQGYDLDNYFLDEALSVVESTWHTTVAYNYYREKYRDGRWISEDYRPTEQIYRTFRSEINCLQALLDFCNENTNLFTPKEQWRRVYEIKRLLDTEFMNAQSWTAMVRTTTNGYGAVMSRHEYWEEGYRSTAEAKAAIQKCIASYDKMIQLFNRQIAEERARKYWEAHPEEKAALEARKENLHSTIQTIDAEYVLESGKVGMAAFNDAIKELSDKKDALGLFQVKEKRALQARIKELQKTRDEIKRRTDVIQQQIRAIDKELETGH